MATYNDVFKRKEIKYRLTAQQMDAMLTLMAGHLKADDYGMSRISSLYLDTPDHEMIQRSLDKPVYKEKLRIRRYGDADEAFVEIKKKYKGVVYKRRVVMSLEAVRAYFSGVDYADACRNFPLEERKAKSSLSPRSLQISREIDAFRSHYGNLVPSIMITVDRIAYAPCADDAEGLRITFDTNIAYRDMAAADGSHALLPQGEAIMEIKALGAMPLWLVQGMAQLQVKPTSFSKCGNAYRVIAGLPLEKAYAPLPQLKQPAHAAPRPKMDTVPGGRHNKAAFAGLGQHGFVNPIANRGLCAS